MKAEVLKTFQDLKENKRRKAGETFTVTQERFDEINASKHGKLVSKVAEKKPKKETEK